MKLPALVLLLTACAGANQVWDLAPGVTLVRGAVNGVLLRAGGEVLTIYGDPRPNPPRADRVLFADQRRDIVWAGSRW